MAQDFPNLTISIRLEDLIQANKQLISETLENIPAPVSDKEPITGYLTREQMITDFGISATTLWRWDRSGYLVPCKLGNKILYKAEEVLKAMENKRKSRDYETAE